MKLEIVTDGQKIGVRRVVKTFWIFTDYLYLRYSGSYKKDLAHWCDRSEAETFDTIDAARKAVQRVYACHSKSALEVIEAYVNGQIFTQQQKEDVLKLTSLMLDLDRQGKEKEANEVHDKISQILSR